MEDSAFHVLLEGVKVGPYRRRTIVGMRIKNTLTSDHVLIGTDGSQLTVADLIGQRPSEDFSANRSGVFSLVRATFAAALIEVKGRGLDIPKFQGEIEARVQSDVLRLAGRYRKGIAWHDDRVKIPLNDVVHARVRGSLVDLWLRPRAQGKPQRIVLELFTAAAAGDLVEWLPHATPYPHAAGKRSKAGGAFSPQQSLLLVAGAVALVFAVVLVALLWPRTH